MPLLINPKSNVTLTPIGINIPIERGNSGYFSQTFDSVSQTKVNIINLLNTKRGERRFQPLFGSGLQNALFEQNLSSTPDILKKIITDDINNWIPNVNVVNVDLSLSNTENNQLTDTYTVYIKVTFVVNNTMDSVDLVLQQNNI
jgi:phage baseplate assembly protein W